MVQNIPFIHRVSHSIGELTAQWREQPIDWEVIYSEQLPKVYNFFRYRLNDDALAQDMTASTFEKAWRARERYRRDLSAFSTWLFSIARNIANDHFRQTQSSGLAIAPLSLDEIGDVPAHALTDDIAQQRADLRQLSALLGELDVRDRELLALKFGAGLTNRAIASVLNLSESNVGTIVNRVMQRLRAAWDTSNQP